MNIGHECVICVVHLERKVKVRESVRPLDPAFANLLTRKGSRCKKPWPYL
jgi:hypothetical protein